MKKIHTILVFGIIICCLIAGCGKVSADIVSANDFMEISKDVARTVIENMDQEYTENADGTYTCDGVEYKYKLTLKGTTNGAVKESIFVVLTNDKNITHDDVFQSLISATMETGRPRFVLLGLH